MHSGSPVAERHRDAAPHPAGGDSPNPSLQPPRRPIRSALDARCLDDAIGQFLEEFAARHGRAPRILHVGNIANNAFVNARLLNERGFDCDVLCNDYYHVMGCPEWDESQFEGDIGDPFFPRWWAVDLKGYRRPRWFVQGPFPACVSYLTAKRRGRRWEAALRWRWLAWERFRVCSRAAEDRNASSYRSTSVAVERSARYFFKAFAKAVEAGRMVLAGVAKAVDAVAALFFGLLIAALVCIQMPAVVLGKPIWTPRGIRIPKPARRPRADADDTEPPDASAPAPTPSDATPQSHSQPLVAEFRGRFPAHQPPLTEADIVPFAPRAAELAPLFRLYDIVQCYSTDPVYGMLVGDVPIVAFEHGTIREIPFEDTSVGRMTLLAYAKASAVVLTNADNLERARQIRPDWGRIVPGLHRFDERPIERLAAKVGPEPDLDLRFGFDRSVKVLLAPARHDHVVKGNDRLIDAIGVAHARHPGRFKVVFVEWGNDVAQSKARIADLGVQDAVHWVQPLHAKTLIKTYAAVDCVIDQFILPCFGGVPIDVMVVGRCPVMTYIDDAMMREYYGESLPVLNCHTVDGIAAAIATVVTDPERCAEVARQARRWMEHHHTHRHVVHWLVQAYRLTGVLGPTAAPAA